MEKTIDNVAVDQEWVLLIKNAKRLGLTMEEIRQFLLGAGQKA
ncbi:anti-repressor SinI family protein [Oceanobacillus massiliensis]|nr:anti-repressor SinI family protein [Oceanobacillus massiliensis]